MNPQKRKVFKYKRLTNSRSTKAEMLLKKVHSMVKKMAKTKQVKAEVLNNFGVDRANQKPNKDGFYEYATLTKEILVKQTSSNYRKNQKIKSGLYVDSHFVTVKAETTLQREIQKAIKARAIKNDEVAEYMLKATFEKLQNDLPNSKLTFEQYIKLITK